MAQDELNTFYTNTTLLDDFQIIIRYHFRYLSPDLAQFTIEKEKEFKSLKMRPFETYAFLDRMIDESKEKYSKSGVKYKGIKGGRIFKFPHDPKFLKKFEDPYMQQKIDIYNYVAKENDTMYIILDVRTGQYHEFSDKFQVMAFTGKIKSTIYNAVKFCFILDKTYLVRQIKN